MNHKLALLGRILFGLPFLLYGIIHFLGAGALADAVIPNLPGGSFWVYLSGIIFVWASLAIITGKGMRTAAITLGVMLSIFVLYIHLPLLLKDAQATRDYFLKAISLAGAAFYIAGTASSSSKHSGGTGDDK